MRLAGCLAFVLAAHASRLDNFTVLRDREAVEFTTAKSNATVVLFSSAICPIADAYVERLNSLYREYSSQGARFVVIYSNINEDWHRVKSYADANGLALPVFKDLGNSLADRLNARTTPEVFVYDRAGSLQYRGRIDDSVNPARINVHNL
ncbi:MAG: redoxin domain-containing protein, partial [Bryobacteraceae bacterium]